MVKKTQKKSQPKKTKKVKKKEVTAKAVMAALGDAPSYYANFFEIAHSPYDFGISLGQIPAKVTQSQIKRAEEKGEVPIEPILEIVFPPSLIESLIEALQKQKGDYEKKYGEITSTQTPQGNKDG